MMPMRFAITCFLSLLTILCIGQAAEVVDWTTSFDKESGSIMITADIDKNWVIYSQHTEPDGPIPLSFEFEQADGLAFEGEVIEQTTPIVEESEMFGITVRKFKEKAEFSQKVSGYHPGQIIKGNVTFMCCDDEKCLPPETISFEVKL